MPYWNMIVYLIKKTMKHNEPLATFLTKSNWQKMAEKGLRGHRGNLCKTVWLFSVFAVPL